MDEKKQGYPYTVWQRAPHILADRKVRYRVGSLGVCLCLLLLTGCFGTKLSKSDSPILKDVSIETYNNGSEDTQYVEIIFTFNKKISSGKKPDENMKITIAGERMEVEKAEAEGEKLYFHLPVTAITRGNLVIEEEKEGEGYPGITEESGKYGAIGFTVDMLIPSGIQLEDVKTYEGKGFRKKVIGNWKIRNITWLVLTEDGVPVSSQMDTYLDNMGDAVALHGHDFLIYDSAMIAEEMAETLNNHFGNQYIFHREGEEIIGERLDGSLDGKLDLEIYTYKNINKEENK